MSFPALVLKKHQNIWVVRDDLFPYGSKARFLDDYFSVIENREVVYGSSPRWGFAQISIAYLAKRHGKKAVLFVAKSAKLSQYSQRAADLGAKIVQVPMGFLTVCEARAREHARGCDGFLLPIGLDVPEALVGIKQWADTLDIEPDEVWSVASSGTLTRGLQLSFSKANFYAVQVGKELAQKAVGRAEIVRCVLPFGKPAKQLPSFPSVAEYDAKAWEFIPKDGRKVRLFWNVGG